MTRRRQRYRLKRLFPEHFPKLSRKEQIEANGWKLQLTMGWTRYTRNSDTIQVLHGWNSQPTLNGQRITREQMEDILLTPPSNN